MISLLGAVLGATFLGVSGCSGPDPGSITFTERPSGGGDTSGTSTTGTDGGSVATTNDPVFGLTSFSWQDPGMVAANASADHQGTVVGKDCSQSTCHAKGNAKNAPVWAFAGTLYAQDGKTTVAKGEIKVVDGTGKTVGDVYTDANGNFWFDNGATGLPNGSKAGARMDSANMQHMNTALQSTNTGCSSATANCHGTTTQGPIHVP